MIRVPAVVAAVSLSALAAATLSTSASAQNAASGSSGTAAQGETQGVVTYPQGTWAGTAPGTGSAGVAMQGTGSAGGSSGTEACGLGEAMAQATGGAGQGSASQSEAATPVDLSGIDQLTCAGGALPEKQSAITAKVQTLLGRANISPGVIDGWWGGMTETAIRDFEEREGLQVDGEMDAEVWRLLSQHADQPFTQTYTITEEDAQVVGPIPEDYSEKAKYERLGYERVTEALAEKFHMDEEFLIQQNPGAQFRAGETITVMVPGDRASATVASIRVQKQRKRLIALDDQGRIISTYPVTIGSEETPSPSGTVEVKSVTKEPWYNYDPETFVQGDNQEKLSLPPGPNNPVGMIWIALDKDGYGLHGTPEPSALFSGASHGCVRMTNWDALALGDMVEQGTTVEFVE